MNNHVSGIDLLLFFSTGHLKVIEKDGQISMARSQELMDRIPNIVEIAEQFLYYSNDYKFNPDWSSPDATSGSTVQN